MEAADESWFRAAVANWHYVARAHLHLPDTRMPTTVVFDRQCAFHLGRGVEPLRWTASKHDGHVTLPDGSVIPVGVVSFAKPDANGTFFVMSLPSVWREKVQSRLGLERLMHAVMLHEASHTAQADVLAARLNALPDDMTDDSLQDAYRANAAYVADYEKERDLFYAAAAAPTEADARRLAREGLAAYRARRARWFTGRDASWAVPDDVFLSMEGLGQWAAYAWLVDPKGAGVDPALALPEMRRGGKHWTQEEGLAIFLVIDRLLPGWQSRVFAKDPPSLEALLALSARNEGTPGES